MKKIFKKLFPSKEMRAYNKMRRRHRRVMIKLAKEDEDFDYGYLHALVITKIKHMYEYYTKRNNVWQTDETLIPIIDSLRRALDLQEELDNLFKTRIDEIKYDHSVDGVTTVECTDEAKKTLEYRYRREQELYQEIYSYIGEYIQYWWD